MIDGKDILPLLTHQPGARTPHEAFYYYFGGQLQAVRSGKWKLHLPLERPLLQLGMGQLGFSVSGRTSRMFGTPVAARLFDLEADISEKREISGQHPEVVARLLKLAEKARDDLGDLERPGKDIRPAGKVANPKPQVMVRQ